MWVWLFDGLEWQVANTMQEVFVYCNPFKDIFGCMCLKKGGANAKAYNTCTVPQAAYNCRGAVHVTDWSGVGPIGRRLSLRPQADLWPTSRTQRVCRLVASTSVIWITTHLPIPGGWKAELAWLVDPWRTPYSRSGHMSTIDQAQIRESSPGRDWRPNHWATPPTFVLADDLLRQVGDFTCLLTHNLHGLLRRYCQCRRL